MLRSTRNLGLCTAGLTCSLFACVTPQQGTPSELTDARLTYGRVSGGEASKLMPAQVHIAHRALQDAEAAYHDAPNSQNTRDLAYIAQRQAQLAETNAQTELARSRGEIAAKQLSGEEEKAGVSKQGELKVAKQKLAAAQLENKSVLSQLSRASNNVKQSERGLIITLAGNVLFDHGKSAVLGSAQKQLNEIAQALNDAKTANVTIEGYTDSTGSAHVNEKLSQARAEAVMNYFVSRGVPASRMHAVGKGPLSPVASNDTAEGRATNRRVELVVQGTM